MRLGWGQILLCHGSPLQHAPLLWLASLSERHRWEGVFLLWEWHPISRQSSVLLRWSVIHPWHTVTLCTNIDSLATQVTLDNKEVTIVCKVVTGWATVLLHPSTKLKQTRFLIDLIITILLHLTYFRGQGCLPGLEVWRCSCDYLEFLILWENCEVSQVTIDYLPIPTTIVLIPEFDHSFQCYTVTSASLVRSWSSELRFRRSLCSEIATRQTSTRCQDRIPCPDMARKAVRSTSAAGWSCLRTRPSPRRPC